MNKNSHFLICLTICSLITLDTSYQIQAQVTLNQDESGKHSHQSQTAWDRLLENVSDTQLEAIFLNAPQSATILNELITDKNRLSEQRPKEFAQQKQQVMNQLTELAKDGSIAPRMLEHPMIQNAIEAIADLSAARILKSNELIEQTKEQKRLENLERENKRREIKAKRMLAARERFRQEVRKQLGNKALADLDDHTRVE